MFLESVESENIILENGVIKSNQKIGKSGFGIRGILGKTSHYFTNSNITRTAIENTCNSLFSSSSMEKILFNTKHPL